MPRLFLALDLPTALIDDVRAICVGLPAARWTSPAQWHVTLRFLGDTSDDAERALRVQLRQVRFAGFEVALRGVGLFPSSSGRTPPQVLWAGVTPAPAVEALKRAINVTLGPDPESDVRGFFPHLTLARFRQAPGDDLARYTTNHAGFATTPWTVRDFRLYRSRLGRQGAVHEEIETYPLQC
jgi:RNA 2',3'-cyclic 3'-phosphodiesterase